jgi:hypothetical protein
MNKKVLFVFEFEGRKPKEVAKINRELFGYTDQSFHGKYTYTRKGLLSKYNIERITKGAFLTDEINAKEIQKILHQQGTKKIKQYFLQINKIIG